MTPKDRRILEGMAVALCSLVREIGSEIQTVENPPDELKLAQINAAVACRQLLRKTGFYEHEEDLKKHGG